MGRWSDERLVMVFQVALLMIGPEIAVMSGDVGWLFLGRRVGVLVLRFKLRVCLSERVLMTADIVWCENRVYTSCC